MKKNGYMYSRGNKVWFTSSILNSVDLFNNLLVLIGQWLTYTNNCVNIFFYMKCEWKGASSNPGYENNQLTGWCKNTRSTRQVVEHKFYDVNLWFINALGLLNRVKYKLKKKKVKNKK